MARFFSKSKSLPLSPSSKSCEGGGIGSAFPALEVELTDKELKEAAYEIVLVASGSVTARVLTYTGIKKSTSVGRPSEKSVTASAASKLKKALGLRSKRDVDKMKNSQPITVIELVRMQLGVSEKMDARMRRALSRTAAGQAGKPSEMVLIPLELLQNINSGDFLDSDEFLQWQKAHVNFLEAGLLSHPKVPLDTRELLAQRMKQVLYDARRKPMETGRNNEMMQQLRSAAVALASRTSTNDKSAEVCHWADGYPLNLHVYEKLLECCFDLNDRSAVIDEMDDVVEVIKHSWTVLGINQVIHNVCLLWVLFRQFFVTGEVEIELLIAARTHMQEVAVDAKEERDPFYVQLLSSTLSCIQTSIEKRLFSYHDTFPDGAAGTMDKLIPSALAAAQILHEDIAQEYRKRRTERVNVASMRIDAYIRSSVKSAFAQMMEHVDSKRKSSKGQEPPLVILAKDTLTLIDEEKTKYSPILRQWHPNPAGVAAATLHSCYSRELKQYLTGLKTLTPDSVQIFQAADTLENQLVQIVVEDGVDSEDGGKSLIREMPPFEGESTIAALAKQWVQSGLEKLSEWADRNMTKEDWSPHVMRGHYAASVVELLRIIEETLDAFFAFPGAPPSQVLQDLVNGIDRVLYRYVAHAVPNHETKSQPRLPPLTRWDKELHGKSSSGSSWFRKDKRKGQVEPRNGVQVDTTELSRYCVRINTLQHLESELEVMEKKLKCGWKEQRESSSSVAEESSSSSSINSRFERARTRCREGIHKLMEAAVQRAVFTDLRAVFWEGLYAGGVENARVDQVVQQMDAQLECIACTVAGRLRNKLADKLMRCCLEAYLLVVLGGGPSRAFRVTDAQLLQQDVETLKDLFKADGEGLPWEAVEKAASTIAEVLPLFSMDTPELVDKLLRASSSSSSSSDSSSNRKSRSSSSSSSSSSLPPNPKCWSVDDPNTILRVLCYRADDAATKFLKKTYNLPKRI